MRNRNRRLAWLIGLLLTAGMFVLIALRLDWRYCQNDDIAILRSFMGYETGEPASFHIFIHGLLAWPIYWLAKAFPMTAWFSVAQIALMFLACWMCAKSVIQCFVNHDRPLWLGCAAALAFAAGCLEICARVTFTQTAALLGAASVLQIFSIDRENASLRQAALGVLAALPPVAFAYALRKEAVWPILAFVGLALAAVVLLGGRGNRRVRFQAVGRSAIAFLAAMLCLFVWRGVEVRNSGQEDYLAWQEARSGLLDYYSLSEIPPEAYESVGWTEGTVRRAEAYFFLDPDISTESLQTLLAACKEAGVREIKPVAVMQSLNTSVNGSVSFRWVFGLTAAAWALCLTGACFIKGERGRLWLLLMLHAALFAALVAYLAFGGRLPTRVLWLAFLPFAAAVAGLLPACIPAAMPRSARTAVDAALEVLALGCAGFMLSALIPELLPDEAAAAAVGDPAAALDEYARGDPEVLFIHDLTLAVDTRLFPDVSEGIPHNVVCWGGWNLRSPATVAQFAAFDIDLLRFEPEELLRGDVCIATGVVDPPPMPALDYLREKVDPGIDYTLYGENGGVYFFQFY